MVSIFQSLNKRGGGYAKNPGPVDDFEVVGAKEAVAALKKAKPQLFGVEDKKVAPPRTGVPAPRGGFTVKPGESTSAHEDLEAGFRSKK